MKLGGGGGGGAAKTAQESASRGLLQHQVEAAAGLAKEIASFVVGRVCHV